MKIHLVDGTYELFRAFYAPGPSRTAPDGVDVKATRGFMGSLTSLLLQPEVTHLAVAFDTVIESFRNDLFDGYKTGEGIDPALWAQFPLVEQAAHALGVVVWPMHEFETDDALATAAARWGGQQGVGQVVICSPDKDFAQCVRTDKVVLLDRRRRKIYDEAGVKDKWGIAPQSMADWLALVGDSADGIPGVARWGAKSAATVLAHFRHIENIPDDEHDWPSGVRGAKALAENLAQHRQEAMLYKRLATLRTDVPLVEGLEDLRWQGCDKDKLQALWERLGETPPLDARLRFRGDN